MAGAFFAAPLDFCGSEFICEIGRTADTSLSPSRFFANKFAPTVEPAVGAFSRRPWTSVGGEFIRDGPYSRYMAIAITIFVNKFAPTVEPVAGAFFVGSLDFCGSEFIRDGPYGRYIAIASTIFRE